MEYKEFHRSEFETHGDIKKGGQAFVEKGKHPDHGDVAIKQYYEGYCDQEVALLMMSANHENIVQFIGILINKKSDPIGYIMPYMSRGNLYQIIHNKTGNYDRSIYTSEQVTQWITCISNGLSYLHSNNIIHRDIKPKNILLGESYDDVRISDFGIARSLETITQSLTKEIVTSVYMAPEMFKGEYYDTSVDIYSLAITIWEILHRRAPFDHVMAKSIYERQTKITNGERPEMDHDLSHDVVDFLKRCWNSDPSLRPKIDHIQKFATNTRFNIPKKETILLLGGQDGNIYSKNIFILTNNKENEVDWKQLDIQLPGTVCSHGAQFLNNHLYIFGGRKVKDEVLNLTHKLSKKLKWEEVANLKQKRCGISNSNVILNGRIWACGGSNGEEALKSVEMYDPETDQWKYVKEMNECRGNSAAAVVNRKIFCCGGWDGSKRLNSVECYDPSSDIWTLLSPMPQPRSVFGAVSMDENLIIMGGWNGNESLDDVWMLETTNDNAEWIEKQKMPRPCHIFSIAKIDGQIFVCGGGYNVWINNEVEIFDGETWTNGPMLKVSSRLAAATVIPLKFAKHLEYGNTRFQTTLTQTISQRFDETLKVSEAIKTDTDKETILLLGGNDGEKSLDSLLILENNGEQWKEAKVKLPLSISTHGVQFLNNYLYIFGGRKVKSEILNSTYKLSNKLKWEEVANLKQKRCGISNSNVILNGRIWACGGSNGEEALKSVEMYDPETNEWKYVKEMNECRSDAAAAVIDGKIFCCGGSDGTEFLNSAECYDPSSDVWTLICKMPEAVKNHGIVTIDRNLVVMGGWIDGDFLDPVWILDTSDENAEWIEKSKMSLPRGDSSIAKIDNKIFVCGGNSGEEVTDSVEIFDGEVWRNGPKLTTPRFRSASIVIPADFAKYLHSFANVHEIFISPEKNSTIFVNVGSARVMVRKTGKME